MRTLHLALIAHYEAVGDMVVRFLAQEERHSALRPLLAQGRREHRAWVAERFGSTQSSLSELERERQITRLIVATDIYTWKLLRRDFGKSQDEVLQPNTASHIHFVGPIREPVAHGPWPRRFPDRPFVLVSLSSMFQGQESTLRNICEAISVLPIEALVTTGRGIAPNALSVSYDVEARSFVPHDAVLPSVDLVVTHAGFGTLMYSAGAGKPALCLPNGRDQNDNAARVEALGLGRTLPPDAPPAAISSAVMDMLGDEALRAASRAFASGVSRFGELTYAADLVERAVAQVPGQLSA